MLAGLVVIDRGERSQLEETGRAEQSTLGRWTCVQYGIVTLLGEQVGRDAAGWESPQTCDSQSGRLPGVFLSLGLFLLSRSQDRLVAERPNK